MSIPLQVSLGYPQSLGVFSSQNLLIWLTTQSSLKSLSEALETVTDSLPPLIAHDNLETFPTPGPESDQVGLRGLYFGLD